MLTAKQKLLQIVRSARGDDLERAKIAFHGMSDALLDQQHGQSGKTRREVLREYETERAEYEAALALAELIARS